jgi:hypothetical protein
MAATAQITCCPAGRRDSDTWDRAAAAKTLTVTRPAASGDLSCMAPATKVGASEVNSPKIANGAKAAIAAPRNSVRDSGGIAKRWGRYGGRGICRRTVSGASSARAAASESLIEQGGDCALVGDADLGSAS